MLASQTRRPLGVTRHPVIDEGAHADTACRGGTFIADDILTLVQMAEGVVSPRTVLKSLITNDALAILVTWRLRVLSRRFCLIGVNHLFRRFQTSFYGIEIGKDVTLGRGVYFIHPV